jgi:hypothetical protein
MIAAQRPVSAQALMRLAVQSFTLSSDNARPHVDEPFHLIVALRVRQRVDRVANLELPMLADVELLGDERQTVSTPGGTQYREAITVVAHRAGAIAFAPATLQAIDARDGKPKQWYTNGVTVYVSGVSAPALRQEAGLLMQRTAAALRLLLWLLGIAAIVAVIVALLRRRPPRRIAVPVVAFEPPPPVIVRTRRDQFEDALTVLRAERTRASAVAVRTAIWRMLGASEGETLGDVLRRPESSDPVMRDLLIALERSAFTYDGDLRGAIEDACAALERSIGSAA